MTVANAARQIRVQDVSHRYKKVVALEGVSLDLPAGQLIGFVGPDGVGKSTLLGLITGAKKRFGGHANGAP